MFYDLCVRPCLCPGHCSHRGAQGRPGLALPRCWSPWSSRLPGLAPARLGGRSQNGFKPLGLERLSAFVIVEHTAWQEMLVDSDGRNGIQGGFLSREDERDVTSHLPDFCVTAKQFIKAPSILGYEPISRASLSSDTNLYEPSSRHEWKMPPFWNLCLCHGWEWLANYLSCSCLGEGELSRRCPDSSWTGSETLLQVVSASRSLRDGGGVAGWREPALEGDWPTQPSRCVEARG